MSNKNTTEYKTILADPPWNERGAGKVKRGADRHYDVMKTDEIIGVMQNADAFQPDSDGCHLYLWVTNNYLPDGLRVIEKLGFRYITNIAWVKRGNIGLGQYFRGAHELLLFAVNRDTEPLDTLRNDLPTVIDAAKRDHSEKPRKQYEFIEKASPEPRLEMFARERLDGWDAWGDQLPNSKQTRID